jgi:hydrogenase/urease accessory protein HupE
MNVSFFVVFTFLGVVAAAGLAWPISRRQFSIIFCIFVSVGLVGALIIPHESSTVAMVVVVLCFLAFFGTYIVLEADARRLYPLPEAGEFGRMSLDGNAENVRRPSDKIPAR